jgi:hypothetical protein
MASDLVNARLAQAHALRLNNVSWRRIGEILDTDHATLWREYRLAGLSSARDQRERLERLQAQAYDAAEDALSHAHEEVNSGNLKGMQKVIAAGILVDKVVGVARAMQGESAGQGDGLGALLSHLGPEGGAVTIISEPNRSIDVTPRGDSE